MKIVFSFYSLKDLSNLSEGNRFLEILKLNGLIIEKASDHEPLKKDFDKNNFHLMWQRSGSDGDISICDFLFKGKKEIKFTGMVTWRVNVHPNAKVFNGIHLWMTVPKNNNINNLVKLGDDIFKWSESVYGYITEESKDPSNDLLGNINDGIPGLLWVNYFGKEYLVEPDFHLPEKHIIVGAGVRFMLTETPEDQRLSDLNFLTSQKEIIGKHWFWSRPRNFNLKVPFFNRSAITNPNLI